MPRPKVNVTENLISIRPHRQGTPPIRNGEDGLPHCGWCLNETEFCDYHREQVNTGLGQMLASANTLAAAEIDIRFLIKKRPRASESVDA